MGHFRRAKWAKPGGQKHTAEYVKVYIGDRDQRGLKGGYRGEVKVLYERIHTETVCQEKKVKFSPGYPAAYCFLRVAPEKPGRDPIVIYQKHDPQRSERP